MANGFPNQYDQGQKSRITSHLNSQHQDSLSLFLQYYCRVPAASSTSPTLSTLALDSLILSYQRNRYYIPLKPPMEDYSETRARLKAMHEDCLKALDLSDVKITRYVPPQAFLERLTLFIIVASTLAFSRQKNFVPGSWFYSTFGLAYVPNFAWLNRTIQPWPIVVMLVIHMGEAVWMARTRLRKHQVRRGSGLWWKWVGTCFAEGLPSFRRLDGIIRETGARERARRGTGRSVDTRSMVSDGLWPANSMD